MTPPLRARALHAVVAVTIALGGPWIGPGIAHALPKNPDAAKQLEEGQRLYKDEKFDEAIEAFKKGYEIENDPAFLYAWAQAERQAGNCNEAMGLYKRFLDTDPPELAAEYAKEGIVKCVDVAAKENESAEGDGSDESSGDEGGDGASSVDEPIEEPVEKPPPPSDRRRHWYRDPLGWVLVGVGTGVAAVGAGLLGKGVADYGSGKQRPNEEYGAFDSRLAHARKFKLAGGITLGIGAAIMIGGAIRWAVLGVRERRGKGKTARVGILFDGRLSGISVSGRF